MKDLIIRILMVFFACILPIVVLYRDFRKDPAKAALIISSKEPSKITPEEAMQVYYFCILPIFTAAAIWILFYMEY